MFWMLSRCCNKMLLQWPSIRRCQTPNCVLSNDLGLSPYFTPSFSDYFKGNKSWIICLNPLNNKSEIWRRSISKQVRKYAGKKWTKNPILTVHTMNTSSRPKVFCKKVILKFLQNSQKHTCTTPSFFSKLQV